MPQIQQILYEARSRQLATKDETPPPPTNSGKNHQKIYSVDFAVDRKDVSLKREADGNHKDKLNLCVSSLTTAVVILSDMTKPSRSISILTHTRSSAMSGFRGMRNLHCPRDSFGCVPASTTRGRERWGRWSFHCLRSLPRILLRNGMDFFAAFHTTAMTCLSKDAYAILPAPELLPTLQLLVSYFSSLTARNSKPTRSGASRSSRICQTSAASRK